MPIATGLFNAPAAPGAQSLVGWGFEPKGLKLVCVGNTVDGTWSDPIRFGYGFTDGTNSYSVCAAMDDNITPVQAYTRAAAKVLTIIDGTGTVLAECDLTSFNADGATLTWTVAAGTEFLIGYIAFGGTGVQTYVQEWLTTAPNGNKSFNASGFTPQVVEFISAWTGGLVAPQSTTNSRVSVGVMDYNGNQWCHNWKSTDGGVATDNIRDTRDDSVVSQNDGALGAITLTAAFVSMEAAGYIVNVTRSFDYAVYSFEVAGLDDVAAGTFTPPVGTGLQATVVGFQPNGVFNVGSGPSLISPRLEDIYTSIGACGLIGTDIGGVMSEPDNNNPSQQKVNFGSGKSFNKAKNVTETWNQRAHVSAYPSTGFQLSWTTADATAVPNRFYIAYAAPEEYAEGELIVQQIIRSGVSPIFFAAEDGQWFRNWYGHGRIFLHVVNDSAAAITVNVAIPSVGDPDGLAVPDLTTSVAAGADAMIGTFPSHIYNDHEDIVTVTYSSVTSVSVAAYKMVV